MLYVEEYKYSYYLHTGVRALDSNLYSTVESYILLGQRKDVRICAAIALNGLRLMPGHPMRKEEDSLDAGDWTRDDMKFFGNYSPAFAI